MPFYNRERAVAYAHRWAFSRNPAYYNFDAIGGDCTNFVSQGLFAGSGRMHYRKVYGWYYNDLNERAPGHLGRYNTNRIPCGSACVRCLQKGTGTQNWCSPRRLRQNYNTPDCGSTPSGGHRRRRAPGCKTALRSTPLNHAGTERHAGFTF